MSHSSGVWAQRLYVKTFIKKAFECLLLFSAIRMASENRYNIKTHDNVRRLALSHRNYFGTEDKIFAGINFSRVWRLDSTRQVDLGEFATIHDAFAGQTTSTSSGSETSLRLPLLLLSNETSEPGGLAALRNPSWRCARTVLVQQTWVRHRKWTRRDSLSSKRDAGKFPVHAKGKSLPGNCHSSNVYWIAQWKILFFQILSADQTQQSGTITRQWNTDLNAYTMNIYFGDPSMDPKLKSLFLGLGFLLEYLYFQWSSWDKAGAVMQ